MNKIRLLIIILAMACFSPLFGQNVKNPRYNQGNGNDDRGATYDTQPQKISKRKERKEFSYSQQFDQKVKEYYERMEANARKYKQEERELKKPQYSDPTYFGHKHPPKKRPPGKKKYCKVCGMYH